MPFMLFMPSMLSLAHASEVESSPASSAASGAFAPENMADLRTTVPLRSIHGVKSERTTNQSGLGSIPTLDELELLPKRLPRVYRRQN
jgi:hypothetical protein